MTPAVTRHEPASACIAALAGILRQSVVGHLVGGEDGSSRSRWTRSIRTTFARLFTNAIDAFWDQSALESVVEREAAERDSMGSTS